MEELCYNKYVNMALPEINSQFRKMEIRHKPPTFFVKWW